MPAWYEMKMKTLTENILAIFCTVKIASVEESQKAGLNLNLGLNSDEP